MRSTIQKVYFIKSITVCLEKLRQSTEEEIDSIHYKLINKTCKECLRSSPIKPHIPKTERKMRINRLSKQYFSKCMEDLSVSCEKECEEIKEQMKSRIRSTISFKSP
jgi:two-component SAPR family response regulator